jgi:hypothetical protein
MKRYPCQALAVVALAMGLSACANVSVGIGIPIPGVGSISVGGSSDGRVSGGVQVGTGGVQVGVGASGRLPSPPPNPASAPDSPPKPQ